MSNFKNNFRRISLALLCSGVFGFCLPVQADLKPFEPSDVHQVKDVGDIAVSPDGQWVAYRVRTTDVDKDKRPSDLFMVNWDGTETIRLTHTQDSDESSPRFSPDGKYLAFLAARSDGSDEKDKKDPKAQAQVWLLNRSGGEAQRLTELKGGVSAFEWSPDSARLVLVSRDPEEEDESEGDDEGKPSHDTPKPIVIDRYQFKRDVVGYLGNRYERLYLFDLNSKTATVLTEGPYDSTEPAWSPNGEVIAFTSKREGDPDRHGNSDIFVIKAESGARPEQVTTWEGPDSNPQFSPDGRRIAYLQGGPPKYAGYDPEQLAVISAKGGKPVVLTAELDRNISSPRWSADGSLLHFLVTDDRKRMIASMPAAGGKVTNIYPSKGNPGVVRSFEVGARGIVAAATFGQSPVEIYRAADGKTLSGHNRELRESVDWAEVEGLDVTGPDGVTIGSMLLKPPGYRAGRKYPTIVHVHGGPVAQDGYEFDAMSQALAAQGYLVVNPNYRGSSGRGAAFSRAIYADWGGLEIQDIHAVVDHLVDEGLADPDRLGIGGWSYGGMNTNYAIATDTRFAAAVSGASVSHIIAGYGTDQYIRQYENEIGLPWESMDVYNKMSYPFLHADRIKTPTLFMCGEKDFNVPLLNSEQMYQALRSLDIPTQLVIYPGQYHGLTKPSYIEDRLNRMIDWYAEYLGAGGP